MFLLFFSMYLRFVLL